MKFIKYILLVLGIILISIGIILNINNEKKIKLNSLNGKWLEESGSLFIIKNNYFYWYKDYNDLNNNYYKGKISYKTLDEYNYTNDYIKEEYGNINKKLFYIIKIYPDTLVKENEKISLDNSYHLLFELLLDNDKLSGDLYNKNSLTLYKIIKYGI
ncbi:MAG: hypothetical protein ACI4OT_03715 [Bacilli bacterium]